MTVLAHLEAAQRDPQVSVALRRYDRAPRADRGGEALAYAFLDQLLAGADPKSTFEVDCLLDELKKALAEQALNAQVGVDRRGAGESRRLASAAAGAGLSVRVLRRPADQGA